jgi:transposase
MVQSSLSSVVRLMQSFRRKGKAGLKPRPTPGRPPEMKPRQQKELIALLKAGARAAGYPRLRFEEDAVFPSCSQEDFGLTRHYFSVLFQYFH